MRTQIREFLLDCGARFIIRAPFSDLFELSTESNNVRLVLTSYSSNTRRSLDNLYEIRYDKYRKFSSFIRDYDKILHNIERNKLLNQTLFSETRDF